MDNDDKNEQSSSYDIALDRGKQIIHTSIIGILANLFLTAFKAVAGLAANSIAIVLDAVNNLTDALSSAITIAGAILAGRKPDKKHPLGHGRSEYLSAMIIAVLILYAGITAAIESVDKIFHPKEPDYSAVTLVILGVAVVVKLVLGRYVKAKGEKVHSDSLKESGTDALFDAVISTAVLLSAAVYMLTGLLLEAYVGLAISAFIIKAGLEMLFGTLDDIVGKRAPEELTKQIKETICEDESVFNAYDLILHSYGPTKTIGSVHVEVDEKMTAYEIDAMERRIAHNVLLKHGILLTGIGVYSRNMSDDAAIAMRRDIENIVMSHEGVLEMHGYYLDKEKHTVSLDIIIDYDIKTREELFGHIRDELIARFPDYRFSVVQDIDI